jgi:hypothetical protein
MDQQLLPEPKHSRFSSVHLSTSQACWWPIRFEQMLYKIGMSVSVLLPLYCHFILHPASVKIRVSTYTYELFQAWRVFFCDIMPVVRWQSTDVMEEHVTSIFRQSQPGVLGNCSPFVYLLHASFLLAYYSILKMEAKRSFETLVDFQWTTRRYNLADRTLHNHGCKNLKCYTFQAYSKFVMIWCSCQ